MLYLIGGPTRVGKTTLAERARHQVGASLVPTDALVWMLQVGAPGLGVRHGSPDKAVSLQPFLGPFVEAATVYGARDLILEGDALTPGGCPELLSLGVGGRAVFLGNRAVRPADLVIGGGYAADLQESELDELARAVRTASREIQKQCAEAGLAYFDTGSDREDVLRAALHALMG